jgi:hypothetical protein
LLFQQGTFDLRAVYTPLSTFHVPDIRGDLLLTPRKSTKERENLQRVGVETFNGNRNAFNVEGIDYEIL